MAIGQGFTLQDESVYFCKQSGKGVLGSAFKGGYALTTFEHTPTKNKVDGVPMLGGGIYMFKSMGLNTIQNFTAGGWITLDTFAAFIFSMFMSKATSGSGPYTHVWSAITKNINMPYYSIAVVHGESSTPGSGILTVFIRDARLTAFSFTISTSGAITWTASFMGLNMGVGAGTETFSFNGSFVIPDPAIGTTVLTWPSWFPASNTISCSSFTATLAANVTASPAGIGTGEAADILFDKAGWTLAFDFQSTSDMVAVYEWINFGAVSALSASSAMTTGLKEGAFSFVASSLDVIPTTSTPYSFAGSFPDVQWDSARMTAASPQRLLVPAGTFGSGQTFTVTNNSNSTAMTL